MCLLFPLTCVEVAITIPNKPNFVEGAQMKSYSAESLTTAAPPSLEVTNRRLLSERSAPVTSGTAPPKPAVLGNLKSPFLEGLSTQELESVLEAATYRKCKANSVIIDQDHPANQLFLLLAGRARFFFITEKGQKIIHLWIAPGEIFGVATFLPPSTGYLVSTEAVRDSSMLVWDRNTLRSLAAKYPRLLENALSMSLHYLAAYHAAHMALICGSARERLAHVLVSLARGIGQRVVEGVELKVSNEELANEANVTLFTASRLLNEWKRKGMLLKKRGKILLRTPESLLRNAT